jgi:hypothetical protein
VAFLSFYEGLFDLHAEVPAGLLDVGKNLVDSLEAGGMLTLA